MKYFSVSSSYILETLLIRTCTALHCYRKVAKIILQLSAKTCIIQSAEVISEIGLMVTGMSKVMRKLLFSSPEPLGSQGELIVYQSSRRPSVRPSSVVVNNFKRLLLQNRWADQSQILCGASLGRGKNILFAASGSHDQDGRHAHIW